MDDGAPVPREGTTNGAREEEIRQKTPAGEHAAEEGSCAEVDADDGGSRSTEAEDSLD